MSDLWEKVRAFEAAREARRAGTYPYFRSFELNDGPEAVLDGRRVLMLGSNNYLGLTTHPKVRAAATEAIGTLGTSMTGSRFVNGTMALHEELEERLAEFYGYEAALVFTTGYQVNLAVCAALLGEGDVALIDRSVHASIYDGIRLALAGGARFVRYRRNSVTSLQRQLDRLQESEAALLIADGVYSAEGEVCDLPALLPPLEARGVRVLVDDAHGLGMLGPGGRGTAHHFGVESRVDLIGGTFSKSLASTGGFLVGRADVLDFVRHHAPSFIFAASGAPSTVAAALAALEVMQEEPWRIERLQENGRYVVEGLRSLGFDLGETSTAIVPVFIRDDARTLHVWQELLEEHGVYTNPFVSPGVQPGRALIRTSYMATHTRDHLDRALDAWTRVGRRHGLI